MKTAFIGPLGMLEEAVQTVCYVRQTKKRAIRLHDNKTEDGEILIKRIFSKT